MILECEGKPPTSNPKPLQIRRTLRALKSYGPSSYASLTDEKGSYLQVAGGGGTCLIELYQAETGKRLRAFGDIHNKACPDGTLLVFRAGKVPMMADEWFRSDQVAEVFCCFLEGREFPSEVRWRPAPGF